MAIEKIGSFVIISSGSIQFQGLISSLNFIYLIWPVTEVISILLYSPKKGISSEYTGLNYEWENYLEIEPFFDRA